MQLVFYIRACYTNCPMYIPLGSPSHTHLSYVFSFSDNFPRNRSRSSTNCFSHSKSSRHQLQDHENESPIHGYIPLTLTSLSTTKENNLGYLIENKQIDNHIIRCINLMPINIKISRDQKNTINELLTITHSWKE